MTEKESLEKLLVYQQDLVAEEECIKKMIDKLNTQAHALQVCVPAFFFTNTYLNI